MSSSRLSIIIVNWNTRELLERCLRSVADHAGSIDPEILVIDNGSSDGSVEMVRDAFPGVRLLPQTQNLGFARAVNLGLESSTGDLVLLLNSDTVLEPETLARVVAAMDGDASMDVLGCRLVNENGDLQTSCGVFPSVRTLGWQNVFVAVLKTLGPGPLPSLSKSSGVPLMPHRALVRLWKPNQVRDVDWVSGAFLLARRSVVERVGGMDEDFWLFGEDMDWCWRVRLSGGRVVYFGEAGIVHIGGGSTAAKVESDLRHYRASLRLYAKHRGRVQTAIYRFALGAGAMLHLAGVLLARVFGRGRADFRSRVARDWGLVTLRTQEHDRATGRQGRDAATRRRGGAVK